MNQASNKRAILDAHPEILRNIKRGVEKEGLRVNGAGLLANTKHPITLGSALTNPHITTDYSESLLELITSPKPSADELIKELTDIHAFVALRDPEDIIWNQSMPAILPKEADIPVAWYGTSNTGTLKHVYREGLAWRYGKVMQCIAGVHYNFSLPESVWDLIADGDSAKERRNNGYMALIRNFVRHSWLLMYLFGASPAVSSSFLQHPEFAANLKKFSADTYYLPWATSLRMSDLGYTSHVQSELKLCYNDLQTFTARIHRACTTPWPAYEAIGTHKDGKRIQLNTNILQIENEYYSNIRPKQTTARCERPNTTLNQRGIQYIEVRCMDIDPWAAAGISAQTSRFLDAYLLCCAIEDSDYFPAPGHCQESQENFAVMAREGRKPGLLLLRDDQSISVKDWAMLAIERILPYAKMLDKHSGDNQHEAAINAQIDKIKDPENTPSARVLANLKTSGLEFHDWALDLSKQQMSTLKNYDLGQDTINKYDAAAKQSIIEQAEFEATDDISFEQYVAKFHAALNGG